MTLIVGLKCADGIVLGADGAATSSTITGQPTIRQSVTNKIRHVSNNIIVGISGSVGMAQRLFAEIQAKASDSKLQPAIPPNVAMSVLREAIWSIVGREMAIACESRLTGAERSCFTSTLIAMITKTGPTLFAFDHLGNPEEYTDELPFVAIGSGQPIADPFLAFLRRIYFRSSQPTVDEGTFWVTWALQHAISTNPGGVGDPIQVFRMKSEQVKDAKGKDVWVSREMMDSELQETRQMISNIEDAMSGIPRAVLQSPSPVSEPPAPPGK